MHRTHMKYLLVAGGALVTGLLAAGTPLRSLLPYLLVLACPLSMVFMMRGMHGGGHGGDNGHGGGCHGGHTGANEGQPDAAHAHDAQPDVRRGHVAGSGVR